MTAHRPPGRGSSGERPDRTAEPDQQGHQPGNGGAGRDQGEHPEDRAAAKTVVLENDRYHATSHEEHLEHDPADRQHRQAIEKERIFPDQSVIVVHGARSLLVTFLVIIMACLALAIAPHVRLPWFIVPGAYVVFASLACLMCRLASSGGIVPPGAHGDSRFMLAVVAATGLAITPTETPVLAMVPLILLGIAASMCGMADGAWIAMAQRHLNLTFFQALRTFARAARTGDATTWRIVTGGRP